MESARRYTSSSYYRVSLGQRELKEDQTEAKASQQEASKNEIIDLQERVESMRTGGSRIREKSEKELEDFRYKMIKYIYQLFFGKEKADKLGEESTSLQELPMSNVHANAGEYTLVPVEKVIYSSEYYHHETETTSFSTQGIVKTADGREISINVDVTMSRSFT